MCQSDTAKDSPEGNHWLKLPFSFVWNIVANLSAMEFVLRKKMTCDSCHTQVLSKQTKARREGDDHNMHESLQMGGGRFLVLHTSRDDDQDNDEGFGVDLFVMTKHAASIGDWTREKDLGEGLIVAGSTAAGGDIKEEQGHSDGSMEEAVGQWWGKGRKNLHDGAMVVSHKLWSTKCKLLIIIWQIIIKEMQGIRWKLWEEEAKNYCSWLSVSEALGWPLPWKSEHQDSVGEMQGIRWKLWEEEAKNYCSWLSVSEALRWPLPTYRVNVMNEQSASERRLPN
ncbi:hypothetical protein B0H10DRAFT_1960593 [Mycena sp. CBHHK59/15]|nr:hypothetical protein B0H10DRAFT_1960593 [Mycena sp. CBHHK59/15]